MSASFHVHDRWEIIHFVDSLFESDEFIRIAPDAIKKKRKDGSIKWEPYAKGGKWIIVKAGELIKRLEQGETLEAITGLDSERCPREAGVWIALNPCTGGKDQDITAYKYILIECDDISREQQLALYEKAGIRFKTLTDSGGKSIHALIPIANVHNKQEYEALFFILVKQFKAFGINVDTQNKNPNRLTRLAGCRRGDQEQKLLKYSLDFVEPYIYAPNTTTTQPESVSDAEKEFDSMSGLIGLEDTESALFSFTPQELRALAEIGSIPKCADSREAWYKVGMGFKREGGNLKRFLEWCNLDDPEHIGNVPKEWNSWNLDDYKSQKVSGKFIILVANLIHPPKDDDGKKRKPSKADLLIEDGKRAIKALNACLLNKKALHVYNDQDGYVCDEELIRQQIAKLFSGNRLGDDVSRILRYMKDNAPQKEEATGNLIQFKNGVLDLDTLEFKPKSPEIIIKNMIPWNYNESVPWNFDDDPDTNPPKPEAVKLIDRVIKEWTCGDVVAQKLLLQWTGYNMLISTPIHALMLIIGPKRNGKSVYAGLLRALVGFHNSSSIAMKKLSDRFVTSAFHDKLANICTENKGEYLEECDVLKAVSAGDPISVEYKGQSIFTAPCHTKMTFCFNQDFRVDDQGALKDRTNVLLFNADFSDRSKQDQSLLSKLTKSEPMEYLIKISVQALYEALSAGQFAMPVQSAEWLERQERLNNPVIEFIEAVEDDEEIQWMEGLMPVELSGSGFERFTSNPISTIYRAYQEWCRSNGMKPMSNKKLSQELQKYRGLTSRQKWIGGRNIKYYTVKK